MRLECDPNTKNKAGICRFVYADTSNTFEEADFVGYACLMCCTGIVVQNKHLHTEKQGWNMSQTLKKEGWNMIQTLNKKAGI